MVGGIGATWRFRTAKIVSLKKKKKQKNNKSPGLSCPESLWEAGGIKFKAKCRFRITKGILSWQPRWPPLNNVTHHDQSNAGERFLAHLGFSNYKSFTVKKKVREKSRECHNHKPSKTPRGRGNRQIQTSTNQTNVRKALRLALSPPSEVIAMLNGLKNTRWKWHKVRHKTNHLVE